MAGDKAKNGQSEAHTRRDPGAIAPSPADQGEASPMPGADLADLLEGSPDLDAQDVLALAAEPALAPRRARGRPEGSLNRKNGDMIKYLAAHGHRDPWVTLSLIQSADTRQLALMLRSPVMRNGKQQVSKAGTPLYNTPDPMSVLTIQMRAAEAIMNYHHSKKPQQLDLPVGDKRPLMVIGEMNVTQINGDDGFMSAGRMPDEKPNEINGTIVRQSDDGSHD